MINSPFLSICLQLECIRLYLMTRFQANKQMIMKVESELCPKIRKRLYKEKLACSKWLACWTSRTKFEVKNGLESFTVDLEEKKCSCRKWDITGISCCHAISCIFFNKEDAKKYVNACYKRTTYIDCYDPIIEPINGQNMWKPSGLPPVQSLSRGDLLASLRRRGHWILINLEVTEKTEVLASQNNASHVRN